MSIFILLFLTILRCRFEQLCLEYPNYKKFNPDTNLILNGSCIEECDKLIGFYYNISTLDSFNYNANKKWKLYSARYPDHILGNETNKLIISNNMFKEELNATLFWKFELVAVFMNQSGVASTSTSMIVMKRCSTTGGSRTTTPSPRQ